MAMNYWESTHYLNWTKTLNENIILESNPLDKSNFDHVQLETLRDYFYTLITKLGQKLHLRQIVVATAIVFFRRFYLRNSYRHFDPRLVIATVLYISAKAEECQVRVDYVLHSFRLLVTDKNDPTCFFKPVDVLDCEFYVVEEMKFNLVLYHPYRPLTLMLHDLKVDHHCFQLAWRVCNDSYSTDAILLYPPFLVAIGCVYIAFLQVQRDPTEWLSKLNVQPKQLDRVIELLLGYYKRYKPTLKQELENLIVQLNKLVPNSG